MNYFIKQHIAHFTFLAGFASLFDVSGTYVDSYMKSVQIRKRSIQQVWTQDMQAIAGDFHQSIEKINIENHVKALSKKTTT